VLRFEWLEETISPGVKRFMITTEQPTMLGISRHNQGFDDPEAWVEYARGHEFKKVKARKRRESPNCESASFRTIGQYVYCSQLIRVNMCLASELLWFKRCYLRRRLSELGFEKIVYRPSPPRYSENPLKRLLDSTLYRLCVLLYYITFKQVCLSPAQLVLAHRQR
jgi:hypothetical protein